MGQEPEADAENKTAEQLRQKQKDKNNILQTKPG